MGFFKIVKKSVSAGWNVSGWVGTQHIKKNAGMIKGLASTAFASEKAEVTSRRETYAQCVKRLGLTEADIQKRIKNSGQIILICLLLSIPVLIYTFYIFMCGYFLSGFVCLMLSLLLLAYSFREHFNRFQMQQRRLGCSFKEWLNHLLNPKKNLNSKKVSMRKG